MSKLQIFVTFGRIGTRSQSYDFRIYDYIQHQHFSMYVLRLHGAFFHFRRKSFVFKSHWTTRGVVNFDNADVNFDNADVVIHNSMIKSYDRVTQHF
jgi:hypothetical protein